MIILYFGFADGFFFHQKDMITAHVSKKRFSDFTDSGNWKFVVSTKFYFFLGIYIYF